jgi:hypothetical protein
MDFVWFAEQTAIISINSIKQLLLVILLVVFFEVRTECLNIINIIESTSASRAWRWPLNPPSAEVENEWELYRLSPQAPSWRVVVQLLL